MASDAAQIQSADSKDIICPYCHRAPMRRVGRMGFFQSVVMPWFGYYPWECPLCRKVKLFADRGVKRRRTRK